MEPPKSSTPSFSQSSTIISSSVSNPPPPPPCLKTSVDDHDRVMLLDLSLSTKEKDNSNHGSKPELNLIDCFKTINSSSSSTSQGSLDDDHYNTHPPPPPPPPPPDHQADQGNDQSCTDHDHDQPRVFSCNYCQRKFYSSQALGGHQNAHKRERTLAKRGQRNITTASSVSFLGFSCPPNRSSSSSSSYPSMASLPLHGCSLNRSLGIQVHSMIHKPSNFLPSNNSMMIMNSPHIFGQNGWSSSRSQVVIDQQPAIGRLAQDSFLQVGMISNNILGSSPSSSSISSSTHVVSGGAARFDQGVRKFSQPSEGINKGYWWDSVSPFKTKQDDLQKLDLSLKL